MKPLDPSRWITTLEAAKLSGFSRPFIERLLAAGGYKGEIRNASERKRLEVKADQFLAWITKCSEGTDPGDLAQIRAEAIVDDDIPTTEKSTPELRATSRARGLDLAKRLGRR
ncbi:hypothetical protein ACQ859_03240 [Roseateles chitinivorans]|uniref:hypothetical protein n=1 Tax=Roseateles chitinivorans TaxID=2917965 RepID=UPI002639C073|nr:hypothetical protein [uncultured Roseateles sp.]